MFANVDFEEGNNHLKSGNIEHIIATTILRKDISLVTRLLLCLKSSNKSIINKGIIEDITKQLPTLSK